jgi:hypothetical protein
MNYDDILLNGKNIGVKPIDIEKIHCILLYMMTLYTYASEFLFASFIIFGFCADFLWMKMFLWFFSVHTII